jgi:hypothetical protein
MKVRIGLLVVGAILVSATQVHAQTTPPDTSQPPEIKAKAREKTPVTAPLGVGTAFNASLESPLDARKAKKGDLVKAEVAEDVTYERSIVFPRGTKIIGHIARASTNENSLGGAAVLFVQFDKAILKEGEEVILNAGIQALAPSSFPAGTEGDGDQAEKASGMVPVESRGTPSSSGASVVLATTHELSPRLRLPVDIPAKPVGELDSNGMFTPESQGAWGRPDMKLYTPTSEGSHGTVLLSSQRNIRLEKGTRLLLVVQPLPPAEPVTE